MDKSIIKKALKNIILMYAVREKELPLWSEYKKNKIDILPNSLIKRGAEKEINALIKANKREVELDKQIGDDTLEFFSNKILELYQSNNDDMKRIFEPIYNIADTKVEIGIIGASWIEADLEHITKKIIYDFLSTEMFLKKYNKRFIQKTNEKDKLILNLKKSIDIAQRFNNQLVIQELNSFIEQINNESFITEELIYKSLFYSLHKILTENFSATTKAVELSNDLIQYFTKIEKNYKPSKNIGKKDFFENGFNHPRSFYYYKS